MYWGRRLVLFTAATVAIGLVAAPPAQATANSGQPGSTCAASNGGVPFSPPKNGESTTALGVDAPAYYEVGPPMGAFAGKRPKGYMLVIHGGGWHLVGKGMVAYERRRADSWRARGWQTINVDYRACARSVGDVVWFKRRVRLLHPGASICAHGTSAGAHLALLLASSDSDLACVIALAGPTDLLAIGSQSAYDPRVRALTNAGPAHVANLAKAAFGAKVAAASPMRYASATRARLLLASLELDPMIPVAQNAAFARAVRQARPGAYVDVDVLPAGRVKFVHGGTSQAALDDLRRREDALVAPLVAPAPVLPPSFGVL